MADIKGIELASEIYGLEDETARSTAGQASTTATQASQTAIQASQTATQASQMATQASQTATEADEKIGNLANLKTTIKTDVVSAINEVLTTKALSNVILTPVQGVTATNLSLVNISRSDNVVTGLIYIDNISGPNMGTSTRQPVSRSSLIPAKTSFFIGYDFISSITVWLQWTDNGDIEIAVSPNVTKGNNAIRIPFTIIV